MPLDSEAVRALREWPWLPAFALGLGLLLYAAAKWLTRRSPKSVWGAAMASPVRAVAFWAPTLGGLRLALDRYLVDEFARPADLVVSLGFVVAMTLAAVRGVHSGYGVLRAGFPMMDPSSRNRALVVRKLAVAGVIVAGSLAGLGVLGVNPGPLLAGGAVGGIILGLALQESLSSVFSGLFLSWDGSVRIGDAVRLPAGQEGTVENVGWRNTQIRLPDQTLLIVPNGVFATSIVTNLSRPTPETSVVVEASVAYGTDLGLAEQTVLDAVAAVRQEFGGESEGLPVFRWRALGQDGVEFRVFVPVGRQSDTYAARSRLIRELHDRFAEAGITVPFPQRVVHLEPGSERA
jgi:small-conductance mechanosensitive channel